MIDALAWINKFYVVSSTRIQTSKMVDVPALLKEFELETSNAMLARNARLQDAVRPR